MKYEEMTPEQQKAWLLNRLKNPEQAKRAAWAKTKAYDLIMDILKGARSPKR